MPWRNSGMLQEALLALGTSVAVVMGLLAKIAHEVKSGERERFFTRRLWLDAPALVVMITIAAGVNVYFELDGWPAAAIAGVSGWAGPRSIDLMLLAVADRVRGAKKP